MIQTSELTRHPLAEHFGSLGRHEYEGLKQGLRDHHQGARVWLYQGRVLCGWHTYLACRELAVEPEYVAVEAADDAAALLKALSIELRRRSMTEQQRCAIWFRAADQIPPLRAAMERIVREAGDRRQAGLKRGKEKPSRQPQVEAGGKGAARVGELLGVSRPVVERDRRLFNLSPEWHAAVAGGARFDTAIRKAATEAKIERAKSLPPVDAKDVQTLHCDFTHLEREAGIVPGSVRLVVLDPPYFAEYVDHYRAVAELAARWLDPRHGMLVAFAGGKWLPDIIGGMTGHLCWHWPASVYYGQTHGPTRGRLTQHVRECQRPVLVFRAGRDATPLKTFNDVIECKEVEKEWDEWQQPLKAVRHYVEAFTEPGDLVVETHGGAFTTAVACLLTKRRYAGCDVLEGQVEKGRLRLREVAHDLEGSDETATDEKRN